MVGNRRGGNLPPAVGGQLQQKRGFFEDKIVIREYDHIIFVCAMVLVAIGLTMVLSASSYVQMQAGATFALFRQQLIGAIMGIAALAFFAMLNYNRLAKLALIGYIFANGALVWVLFFGREVNGAMRWIDVGGSGAGAWFTFQPSELAKIALVLMLAVYINNDRDRINRWWGIAIYALLTAIPVVLVALGRNLSTVIILSAMSAIMLFLASPYFWRWIILAVSMVSAGLFALRTGLLGGMRGSRMAAWEDPFSDPQGFGFQTVQSLLAVGSGGLFGRGLGNSIQKRYYLPEAQNDFIFAIIIEELGLFGGAVILLLFAILVWRGMRVAINAKSPLGMLIATGITAMFALQVLINVGVVTNTIPNTGIPLPFISYGGTSIAVMLGAVGILLNISKYQKI
ncbi:MAG: FtsW/RodA/SpoVE family cell cycle protein [Defluviitaleaceae bacterium]|nr:FtsW/RodA/SpoVE family cell cycle protein [Defluviitaleaceae bacterium]